MGSDPSLLIDLLDLVGVLVFGISGGLVAVNRGMDIIGVLILAGTTGLGGGMMRDVLIGATPPAAFSDPWLLAAVAVAGLITFFFHPAISRAEATIEAIDAIGLALFAVVGAFKALDYGLDAVPAVLMGLLTAIGGGVLRDMLGNRLPDVFRSGLYATPAVTGAAIAVALVRADVSDGWAAFVGGAVCFGWRMIALRNDWNAPMPRPVSEAWVRARALDRGKGWRRGGRGPGGPAAP
ncbi:trimeric intracellular cation channel family protein [Nocardioides sp.]|uniref:trimeric intracellular cation channel family protein n=1 Tax=Nocardioides sp. TaxID=35761 RepID=UPI002627B660|nr:trimeric intracellular cation channel family protein [Nocardioides sp.]